MTKKEPGHIRKEWPRVQRVSIRGQVRYKVDGRPYKERLFFRERNDALVQADVWARERENRGIESLEFPTTLRLHAEQAARLLSPFGKTIIEAATHFVAHLNAEAQKRAASAVSECLDLWLKQKRNEAASRLIAARTIRELEGRAKLFKTVFGNRRVTEIDEDMVRTFLDSTSLSQRSRMSIRTKLVQFFNFCRVKTWINSNPAEGIKIKVPNREVSILTPAQARALLKAAAEQETASSLVPYVAICLFAGLRPGEAEQLDWANIHISTGQIEVRAETSKTRETRFVKIEPVLEKWLKPYTRKSGILIGANFRRQWETARSSAGYKFRGDDRGIPWPSDVMRHSFGSYWLAKYADRPRLAEEMGNTVEVIKAHYKRATPRHVADEYWALAPTVIGGG